MQTGLRLNKADPFKHSWPGVKSLNTALFKSLKTNGIHIISNTRSTFCKKKPPKHPHS